MSINKQKERCLLVAWTEASFVRGDLKILEEEYTPVFLQPRFRKGLLLFVGQLEMLFLLLWYIPQSKFTLVWFADYHSVLPVVMSRFFCKLSYIVIGGYDAANMPEIGYGGHIHPFRSWCIIQSCRFASKLLPVSLFAQKSLEQNLGFDISEKTEMVYNGADLTAMQIDHSVKRKPVVATICGGSSLGRLIVKGIDFFLDVAKENANVQFLILGPNGEALEWINKRKTENVRVLSWVPYEEISATLNGVSVICQFSRYEAFGVGLLEGMSCGCIPVGCSFTATGELIAGTPGLVIDELDVEKGSLAIQQALCLATPERGTSLADHVRTKFSMERRSKALHVIFSSIDLS